MVKISTQDNKIIDVDQKVACMSVIVKDMLTDLGDVPEQPIPIPNVSSEVYQLILEWCEHHKNDTPPAEEENEVKYKNSEDIAEWDKQYLKKICPTDQQNELLFKIILAANYLDIKPLLDLGSKCVANMIKGKTAEQIRQTFGLVNDFTPEEEEAIRRENAWADFD
ncbi:hypothetical protein MIR68_010374 [Amoeboaphelidium protococcarum]|nr:hypothetical protein MIR68_010374 [Amoeboaphelidium protococcarum]